MTKLSRASALFLGLSSAALSGAAFADPCNTEGMRSIGSNDGRELIVVNQVGDRSASLYWIDFEGNKKLYATIPPNGRHVQPTFRGHVWISENSYGYCDVIFTVENNVEIIIK